MFRTRTNVKRRQLKKMSKEDWSQASYLDKWEKRQKENIKKMAKQEYEVKYVLNIFKYKLIIFKKL